MLESRLLIQKSVSPKERSHLQLWYCRFKTCIFSSIGPILMNLGGCNFAFNFPACLSQKFNVVNFLIFFFKSLHFDNSVLSFIFIKIDICSEKADNVLSIKTCKNICYLAWDEGVQWQTRTKSLFSLSLFASECNWH